MRGGKVKSPYFIVEKGFEMSRICPITAKSPLSGHSVSHSEIKTNRVFRPNLQAASFFSDILGVRVSLRLTSRGIKTVEKNGGIDAYLLGRGNSKLSDEARTLKKRIDGAKTAKGIK